VILRDQGRLLPKPGFLAQMSQTAATVHSDQFEESWENGPRGCQRATAPDYPTTTGGMKSKVSPVGTTLWHSRRSGT
jgi:hypothetical protein